jgi:hypothetical protein
MRDYPVGVQVVAVGLVCIGLAQVRAEPRPAGTVTGQGFIELKRQPEYLRVQVDVLAKGRDVTEALVKLRERRQAAHKQLEQLGVVPSSVEFGKPVIVIEKNDRQRQMFMMMRQNLGQGKKPAQKPKEPPPIIVSCSLRAELRLNGADPEEQLIQAHTLEERMKLADLGGTKELKQASAQDEEQEQEEAAQMMGYNDADAPKPGEPIFWYVSKISEEEQAKARAEAFKRAEREAGRLARAAGVELGPLYHLEDNSATASAWDGSEIYMNNPYAYRVSQLLERARGAGGSEEKHSGEAVGLQPGKVYFRIVLSASFELKKPAGK